jgi:hypothetical protein
MSTTTDEVSRYVSDVEAACADLTAAQRQALLADLPQHLDEVAEGGPLREQLGSPQQYADTLRESANLPPRVAIQRARPTSWWRSTLHDLRPAWWVLRCYVAVWVLALVSQNWYISYNTFPFPAPLGRPSIGLLAVLLLIPASLWLGHRRLPRPAALAWVMLQIAATAYALAFFIQVVGDRPN